MRSTRSTIPVPARTAVLLCLVLLASLVASPSVGSETQPPAVAGCADNPDHPGGDWRHHGGPDSLNSRNQWSESVIGPENAGDLEVAWVWKPTDDGLGVVANNPIIFQGCLILAGSIGSSGHIVVRNADTGEFVWKNDVGLEGNSMSLVSYVITGSPAVSDDFWIYVGVGRTDSPYTAAYRPTVSGEWELAWTTTVDDHANSHLVTGPVLYDAGEVVDPETGQTSTRSLLFQGFMGAESSSTARGGYAILDPKTGEILAKDYTIDQESYDAGYRGASVWGTAAIDPETLYIYAPTGNPSSNQLEHEHANAVIKIDGDPSRETFGQIVDSYKGNPDNYVEQVDLYDSPVCSELGEIGVVWGQLCLQQDLDFGAAPSLMVDEDGRKVVGALQKSGVYHWFDADTMDRIATTVVGAPGIPLNAASPAYDGQRAFVNGAPPGQLLGLGRDDALIDWVDPAPAGYSFIPVSVANGVVYMMDPLRFHITDAQTGVPIDVRTLTQEMGTPTSASGSAGISIARNTVYAAIESMVIAYRLPE